MIYNTGDTITYIYLMVDKDELYIPKIKQVVQMTFVL